MACTNELDYPNAVQSKPHHKSIDFALGIMAFNILYQAEIF